MRFSSRVPDDLSASRLSLRWTEMLDTAVRPLDLTESNPTRVGLSYPEDEILGPLAHPESLRYQPTALGLAEARRSICEYYLRRRRREIDPEDILLTAGTSEAYSLLFKLWLECGQMVLAPRPGYPLIDCLARAESVRVGPLPYLYDGSWRPVASSLDEVDAACRLLVLVHPVNPTGAYLRESDWRELKTRCLQRRLAVICDEVFFDYPRTVPDERIFDPLVEEEVPLMVLNGLSKAFGLPQMKLGWILLRGPQDFKERARQALEVLADNYLSVSTPVQWALSGWLGAGDEIHRQISDRVGLNLSLLKRTLDGTPAEVLPVEGGWSAVIRVPRIRSDQEWAFELLEREVRVHPGYLYDFPEQGYLVVSLLPEPDLFQLGAGRIVDAVAAACDLP